MWGVLSLFWGTGKMDDLHMNENLELPLYQRIARQFESAIASGSLARGDRLPSVRELSGSQGVSVSTALLAYRHLENRLLIEARPKSGYFVARATRRLDEPKHVQHKSKPSYVGKARYVMEILEQSRRPNVMPFGAAIPGPQLFPSAKLQRLMASLMRRQPNLSSLYSMQSGHPELQHQIARRAVSFGCNLEPEEIVITNGGMEALNLALRAVAKPGDTVALESPVYFGVLQVIEDLDLKVLEIPTHPRTGISLEALDLATQKPGAVKACIAMPNFHNPLGSLMPDSHKKRLVELLARRGIPLIEDDIYGELYFGKHRPSAAKAWDKDDNVILVSSFSKILAPGFRIGWMAPGRHLARVRSLKFTTSISTAELQQLVIARFMQDGGFDHHLRRLRSAFHKQILRYADAVAHYFPDGCRLSLPQGGYLLWIELPASVDAQKLFDLAMKENISIAPGNMFCGTDRFDHYIRLNCGHTWSDRVESSVRRLGALVADLAK